MPVPVVPTQWIMKQTTELGGRVPSPSDWNFWVGYYSQAGCDASTLATLGKAAANGPEFANLYPEATDKTSRVLALVRAVHNREPTAADWTAYYTPYANSTKNWSQTVDAAYTAFDPAPHCDLNDPSSHFGTNPALDVPAPGTGPRTQAVLQQQLDQKAQQGGGTVWLDPWSVIRVGGPANSNQGLRIPAGVTLATTGSPGPTQYARMARIVPAGRICEGFACGRVGVVRLEGGAGAAAGAKLTSVWVDGSGTASNDPDPRLNFQIANVQTLSGNGNQVTNARISDPPVGGVAVRAEGVGTRGTACTNEVVTGNLISAYSSDHEQTRLGGRAWADGISIECEHASVTANALVDVPGIGVALRGIYVRSTSSSAVQHSTVSGNTVVSAGASSYAAFAADQVGTCIDATGNPIPNQPSIPIPCLDAITERPFTGASISGNTLWGGSRTIFHIGLMVGSQALYGDNADGTFGRGLSVTGNVNPLATTRANAGIAVGGMYDLTLQGNSTNYTLDNATPGITFNRCAQVQVGQSQQIAGHSGATYAPGSQAVTVVANSASGETAPPSLYGCLVPDAPVGGLELIDTTSGPNGAYFVGTSSGERFIPWGQNYNGPPGPFGPTPMLEDSIRDDIATDTPNWAGIVADLREQKHMGSNIVRVLINFDFVVQESATTPGTGVAIPSRIASLQKLADVALENGIYLDITGLCRCTDDAKPVWYESLSDQQRWAAQSVFWQAVATGLSSKSSIMVYDLVNEPWVASGPRTSWDTGTLAGYSFQQWLLREQTSTPQAQLATNWINQMVASIRTGGDTTRLVTLGHNPNTLWWGGIAPAVAAASNLDYLSPHEYVTPSNPLGPANDVAAFAATGKAVLIEETFLTYTTADPAPLTTHATFLAAAVPPAAGMIGQWGDYTLVQPAVSQDPSGLYHLWGALFMHYSYFMKPLDGIGT